MLRRSLIIGGLAAAAGRPTFAGFLTNKGRGGGGTAPPDVIVPPPTIGPTPLPVPYPLQPGFTAITDASQITSAGNYQLTTDVTAMAIAASNVTVDGGGHTVLGGNLSTNGTAIVVKNFIVNSGLVINGTNITFINNWAISKIQNTVFTSYVTVSNNLFDEVDRSTDDPLTAESFSGSLSNLQILNNIFQNAGDIGFEGVGGWTQSLIKNNRFNNLSVGAMGGWWDIGFTSASSFQMTYCIFQDNFAEAATVPNLYVFNGNSHGYANDDATAAAMWGGDGTDGNIIHHNTFTGNGWL